MTKIVSQQLLPESVTLACLMLNRSAWLQLLEASQDRVTSARAQRSPQSIRADAANDF